MKQKQLSPLMIQVFGELRQKRIYLAQSAKIVLVDSAWNRGLSVEWHGKRFLKNRIHRVSVTFSHREGCSVVDVFDADDGIVVASLPT